MSKSVSILFLFLLACGQAALAAPPGVTFGAGNHLNMGGNRINNLEMAATPGDKDAVNVAYVKALETRVATLEANNSVLETRLSVLETLLEHFSREGDQIIIENANLHVRSGAGSTDAAPNGLGNVIIGYDEARQSGNSSCSLGQYDNETDCTSAGGTWALNHKSGSHNLVVGKAHNYSRYGGLVIGYWNTISGSYSAVSGGLGNTASGYYSAVSGGLSPHVSSSREVEA
ncbi:hypothetical protein [Thiolapillus sp.]